MQDKKVAILGMARSGIAAALKAQEIGCSVMISEYRREDEVKANIVSQYGLAVWNQLCVNAEFGGHSDLLLEYDYLIVSPGIPLHIPILRKAATKGVKIISEIEFGYIIKAPDSKIIAVTGSNGKSTTVTLIDHLLKKSGYNSILAGNIGQPLTSFAIERKGIDYIVLELSSFQLESVNSFSADKAVILNITPDHLDRYSSIEEYTQAKLNIFNNQTDSRQAILNRDDSILSTLEHNSNSRLLTFGLTKPDDSTDSIYYDNDKIIAENFFEETSEDLIIYNTDIPLPGIHNLYNIMAALLCIKGIVNDPDKIKDALKSFTPLPHRLERVDEVDGVQFINDTKATNTDSVRYALTAFQAPIHIIIGGYHKGEDYSVLNRHLAEKAKAIYLIGNSTEYMLKDFNPILTGPDALPCYKYATLEEAVKYAFRNAEKGEIVLLAPACASYDMFVNFEHRGNVFREQVKLLKADAKSVGTGHRACPQE